MVTIEAGNTWGMCSDLQKEIRMYVCQKYVCGLNHDIRLLLFIIVQLNPKENSFCVTMLLELRPELNLTKGSHWRQNFKSTCLACSPPNNFLLLSMQRADVPPSSRQSFKEPLILLEIQDYKALPIVIWWQRKGQVNLHPDGREWWCFLSHNRAKPSVTGFLLLIRLSWKWPSGKKPFCVFLLPPIPKAFWLGPALYGCWFFIFLQAIAA